MNPKELNRVLSQLYESASFPQQWTNALSELSRLLNYESIAVVPMAIVNNQDQILSSVKNKISDKEYVEYYQYVYPKSRLNSPQNRRNIVIRDTDILSDYEIKNSEYYVDFLNRYGCSSTERCYISLDGNEYAIAGQIGLHYERKNDDGIDISFISNHVKNCLTLSDKFRSLTSINSTMEMVYNKINIGICILDSKNKVIFINKFLENLKDSFFFIREGSIHFNIKSNHREWEKIITLSSDTGVAFFSSPNEGKMLARLITLPDVMVDSLGMNDKCKTVFFYGFNGSHGHVRDILRAMGLSPAEASLAQILGQTTSLKDSANILNISYESARTSIKTIFSKLNINSQNELMSIITKISITN